MTNKKKFQEYMTGMSEIYNKEISTVMAEIYWQILEPFDNEACSSAFKTAIATSKTFPVPSDLLKFLETHTKTDSENAWREVVHALKFFNPDFPETHQYLSPMTKKAVEALGGLTVLSRMTFDELHWQEKRFSEIYASVRSKKLYAIEGGKYRPKLTSGQKTR